MSASRHSAGAGVASEHIIGITRCRKWRSFNTMGLREVMLEELRDLYSAENQLDKGSP